MNKEEYAIDEKKYENYDGLRIKIIFSNLGIKTLIYTEETTEKEIIIGGVPDIDLERINISDLELEYSD